METFVPLTEIDKKKYMSLRQACDALGVTRTSIKRKLQNGLLNYVRQETGQKNIWILRSDVIAHGAKKHKVADPEKEQEKVEQEKFVEECKKQNEEIKSDEKVGQKRYLKLSVAEVQRRLKYEQMVEKKRNNQIAEKELIYVKDVVQLDREIFRELFDTLRGCVDKWRIAHNIDPKKIYHMQKDFDTEVEKCARKLLGKYNAYNENLGEPV